MFFLSSPCSGEGASGLLQAELCPSGCTLHTSVCPHQCQGGSPVLLPAQGEIEEKRMGWREWVWFHSVAEYEQLSCENSNKVTMEGMKQSGNLKLKLNYSTSEKKLPLFFFFFF